MNLKRLLTAACSLALIAGCGATRNDTPDAGSTGSGSGNGSGGGGSTGTTNGGSTGTTGTTGNTTSGTSGSSGTGCQVVANVAAARTAPSNAKICLNNVTTLFAVTPTPNQYAGKYYVADGTGAIYVYISKSAPATFNPTRGNGVNVTGLASVYQSQVQISGGSGTNLTMTMSAAGSSIPAPAAPTIAQLDPASTDNSMLGKYVQVPTGTYTVDSQPAEFKYVKQTDGGSTTYYDGVKLTSGSNSILVDTYSFNYANKTCTSPDGGASQSFQAGGFKGVFDTEQTPDGVAHKVVMFGDCSDLQ